MARQDYVYLDRLIGHYLADLFPGTKLLGYWPFRVTRNSELYIDEEETANLLKAVENELHNRRKGDAVRLEIDHQCPPFVREPLLKTLRLTEDDLYLIDGPLNPTRLMALTEGDHSPELRDPPFVAPVAASLRAAAGLVRRHPRAGHPAASSLRELQQRGGVPGTGGLRPGRAGDQADALPHRAATGASSARWRTRCGTASR